MKYLFPVLLVLVAALVLVGCAKKAPLTPAAPWADVRNDALCFLTTATDPSGLKVQYVFDWGNGDSTTTGLYKSGDTVSCPRSFPDTGTFHIRVKARNEQGRVSKWSDECLFHASTPPQLADTIVGFTRWAVDRWYRPSVKVTDPDGDSVSVKFIWGDSMTSGWSPFVASGGTVTDSVKWQTTGRRVIHVLLKDKGSMVNPNAGAKVVNVSQVAVLWYTPDSIDLGSYASPAMGEIDGGLVLYVAGKDWGVACLGLDGGLRWTALIGGLDWRFAPSLSNDNSRLYLVHSEYESGLNCLDARSGNRAWGVALDGCMFTPAVGPDGAINALTYDIWEETVLVTRMRDCGDSAHVEWSVPFPRDLSDPPIGLMVGSNGVVYAVGDLWQSPKGLLFAIDTTGAILWQDTTPVTRGKAFYAPVVDSRGRLILGDGDGNLLCYNADGTIVWSTHVDADLYGGGITIGYEDRIYFRSEDDRLYCYDSDGRWVWDVDCEISASSPCVLSDSTVLTYCYKFNELACYSWDGDVLWTFRIEDSVDVAMRHRGHRDEGDGETTPLVGPDGNVYLAGDNSVYCVAIGKAHLANTAWPTYNHDNARSGWAGRQQR